MASKSATDSDWKRKQQQPRTVRHPLGVHVLRYAPNRGTRYCQVKGCRYIEAWDTRAQAYVPLRSYEGPGAYGPDAPSRKPAEPALVNMELFPCPDQ